MKYPVIVTVFITWDTGLLCDLFYIAQLVGGPAQLDPRL